jgi:Ala-tRNA(Pro) deacylase
MSLKTYEQLVALLNSHHASYESLTHPPVKTSQEAAEVRHTALQQGAKAMVCRVKISANRHRYVLAVFPADRQADFARIAAAVDGKKASLATPEEAARLTDCEMGAVPPVSFHPDLTLVVDPSLLSRNERISFNAGLRDRSLIIAVNDYRDAVQPCLKTIIRET